MFDLNGPVSLLSNQKAGGLPVTVKGQSQVACLHRVATLKKAGLKKLDRSSDVWSKTERKNLLKVKARKSFVSAQVLAM